MPFFIHMMIYILHRLGLFKTVPHKCTAGSILGFAPHTANKTIIIISSSLLDRGITRTHQAVAYSWRYRTRGEKRGLPFSSTAAAYFLTGRRESKAKSRNGLLFSDDLSDRTLLPLALLLQCNSSKPRIYTHAFEVEHLAST